MDLRKGLHKVLSSYCWCYDLHIKINFRNSLHNELFSNGIFVWKGQIWRSIWSPNFSLACHLQQKLYLVLYMFLKPFRCFNLSPEIRIYELYQLVQILAKMKHTRSLDFVVYAGLLIDKNWEKENWSMQQYTARANSDTELKAHILIKKTNWNHFHFIDESKFLR